MMRYCFLPVCLFAVLVTACGSASDVTATQAATAGSPPTATGMPIPIATSTTTPVPEPIEFNVLILGCNTGVDIAHGMGEVTNIYALIQNVGGAEANNVQVTASANDEGRPHPDKSQTIPRLPPDYEITFKFTVDTQFREGTTVAIDLTSEEGTRASDSRTDCRQLDRGDLSVIDLAILQGVRNITK